MMGKVRRNNSSPPGRIIPLKEQLINQFNFKLNEKKHLPPMVQKINFNFFLNNLMSFSFIGWKIIHWFFASAGDLLYIYFYMKDKSITQGQYVQQVMIINRCGRTIRYSNSCQVEEGPRKLLNVEVSNEICKQDGDTLIKVTKIGYDTKIIKIIDKFELLKTDQVSTVEDPSQIKGRQKIMLFNQLKQGENRKKDKKNLVKNIVKLFISWLQSKVQERVQGFSSGLLQVNRLLKINNYNNSLIHKLFQNQSIGDKFIYFLQKQANLAIHKSYINDKETHHEAVKLYIGLYPRRIRVMNKNAFLEDQFFHLK